MARSPALDPSIKPHAVAFPFPEQGHITAMMILSQKLASRGFIITFAVLDYYCKRIKQMNAVSAAGGVSDGFHHIRIVGLPDGLDPGIPFSSSLPLEVYEAFLNIEGELEALIMRLPDVTCLISDFALGWTQDLANRCRIPRVCFSPIPVAVYAMFSLTPQYASNGFDPLKRTVKRGKLREHMDTVSCLPGIPSLHPADLPFHVATDERESTQAAVQWLSGMLDSLVSHRKESLWILCNSFMELEMSFVDAFNSVSEPKVHLVGPLVSPSLLENGEAIPYKRGGASLFKEDECLEWLDKQKAYSVLYISFGSLVKLSAIQVQEIYFGLVAIQQPFLWALRSNQNSELLPPDFQDYTAGKIISWAPQDQVLAHRSIGGFFTHCGWNSVLESISAGVPILAWPFIFDQVTNCWLIVHQWKIGMELEWEEGSVVERAEIGRAVTTLMEESTNQELRARVAQLKNAGRRAASGGSSAIALDLFALDMRVRAQKGGQQSNGGVWHP